jgi:hypothetical protein
MVPPPMGVENGDAREGEDKYPSFAEILKKNTHFSPSLTRGRKSNINRREKEVDLGIIGGSQSTLDKIIYSNGIAWHVY